MPETPYNRTEYYLAKMIGLHATPPDPWSRKEQYLDEIVGKMEGIEADIKKLYELISAINYGQSDWSENTPDAPAYIKNRTHYKAEATDVVPQYDSTSAGSTPDPNYVWFIEKVEGHALSELLLNVADGDVVYMDIAYSVNGAERTEGAKFVVSIEDGNVNLDSVAEPGNRWRGAYASELDGDTTFRWPVTAADSSATVYITGISYQIVKELDAKYIPVDGKTIVINADGKLEIVK